MSFLLKSLELNIQQSHIMNCLNPSIKTGKMKDYYIKSIASSYYLVMSGDVRLIFRSRFIFGGNTGPLAARAHPAGVFLG